MSSSNSTSTDMIVTSKMSSLDTTADEVVRNVTLVSNEGDNFIITDKVANISGFFKSHIESHGEDEEEIIIPVFIDTAPLVKVVEFMKHYVEVEPMTEMQKPLADKDLTKLVQPFYYDYIAKINRDNGAKDVWEFLTVITILQIMPLMDLTCSYAVSLIKGVADCAQVREAWGLPDNLTPEEKEQKRKDNEWMDGC